MNKSLLASLICLVVTVGCTKNQATTQAAATGGKGVALAQGMPSPTDALAVLPKASDKVVNLFIWANYTTPKTLSDFTQKTGIRVVESTYASNEELLAKLQAGGGGYDVIVPSDYMVAVMAKLGMLESLDRSKLSNFSNLDPQLLGRPFDPQNAVSVPYAWSLSGIAINTELYKEPVTSWSDLLQNPRASGHVAILDDVREGMAMALKLQGASVNSVNPTDIERARMLLVDAKKHLKAFNSSPLEVVASGDVWMAQMYATEALQAARNSGGKVAFVVPQEGATIAIDNLAIPKSAPHKEWAHMLIDHLLTVEANVAFVSEILAGPVLTATKEQLSPALRATPALFPTSEQLGRSEMLQDLGETTMLYDRAWSQIKAARH